MADEPKSDSIKMEFWAKVVIAILFILVFIPAYIYSRQFGDSEGQNLLEGFEQERGPYTLNKLIGEGELRLGNTVITNSGVSVRRSPGGQILGIQEKLSNGKLIEGPINEFKTIWWRVNFEEAPSGWVEYNFLTSRTLIYKILYFPVTLYKTIKPIGWILSIILLIIVFVYKIGITKQHKILQKQMDVEDEQALNKKELEANDVRNVLGLPSEENKYKNQRWEHILELMKSNSQNDWRQAIIEADIILDEMLRRMSYKGLTIGDMLKNVDPADFATLQKAWDAHKFRNEIAHTGSQFVISRDEAGRVIDLYRSVFDEFYYI